jgi:hypothetical protein
MSGARNIVTGMRFSGTGARAVVGGTNNKLIANEFTGGTSGVIIRIAKNASQPEIAYNELHNPGAHTGSTGDRYGIRTTDDGPDDFAYNGWIHHNYFHDWIDKPDPNNYSSGQTDAIEICETGSGQYASIDSGYYIESNLVKDHPQGTNIGAATIDMKCGGGVVRYNTFINVPGNLDQRGGSLHGSTFESNYLDANSGGMRSHGYDHKFIGNRILGNKRMEMMAGNLPCSQQGQTNGHSAACDNIVAGNNADLTVGRFFNPEGDYIYDATGTVIEQHTGNINRITDHETGAVDNRNSDTSINFTPAVQLTTSEVGPDALADASAAYRAARGL